MKAVTPGIMTRPIMPAFALMQQGLTGLRCGALFPAAWPPNTCKAARPKLHRNVWKPSFPKQLVNNKSLSPHILNNIPQVYHKLPRWTRLKDSRKASRTNTYKSRGMDGSRDNNVTDTEVARWAGKSPHLPRAPFNTQRSSWVKPRTRFATLEGPPRFRGNG